MAIEPIKKITVVSRRESKERLMKAINSLGVMQVTDLEDVRASEEPSLRGCDASTEEVDEKLHQIDFVLNLMNLLAPEELSFVSGLTPVPLVTSPQELQSVLDTFDLERAFAHANQLDEGYRSAERVIGEIENELAGLEPLSDLPFTLGDFHFPSKVQLIFGHLPQRKLVHLGQGADPWDRTAWEVIPPAVESEQAHASDASRGEERVRVVVACLPEAGPEVRKALASIGFEEIQLPKLSVKVSERIEELRSDLAEYRQKADETTRAVKSFAEQRRALLILRAYWENVKNTHLASTKGIEGRWVHVIRGYIREKDTKRLIAALRQQFPESEIMLQDPAPDEDVPVSISVPHLFRPLQVLVEMFGLPPYTSFDPTLFLQANFYLFFGICFSDVCYGIMLAAFGAYLASKTKAYRGVNNFARILLYGGISSIVFGALTGSWFGDLYKPEYLGEGNFLQRLQETFVVLDPINKTIVALLCALGIGVLNQFYGIVLRMYGAVKSRDFLGAFSDGLCWIVTLSGLLMMAGKIFVEIPATLFRTGLLLFGLGAVCLILTQGREIKNPLGRLAAGFVSLYGIMGSYGITAFIGDTLSYCRLLALGLTTSIVAMTFNLIAGMLRDIPYIGMVLFIFVLVLGHAFNFCISVLGAFVHSMRLIFVEFFGRFYNVGSRPFQPLGFDSSACIMSRAAESVERRPNRGTGVSG